MLVGSSPIDCGVPQSRQRTAPASTSSSGDLFSEQAASRGVKSGMHVAFNDRASTAGGTERRSARKETADVVDGELDVKEATEDDGIILDDQNWHRPPFRIRPTGVPELPLSQMRLGPNKQRRLLSSAKSARELRKLPTAYSKLDEQSSGLERWPSGQRSNGHQATPPWALQV